MDDPVSLEIAMTSTRKTHWLFNAAAAAVLALSPLAFAQQRVGEEGRALDANNRVGSGGYNSRGISGNMIPGTTVTGNNIVTGNVTGGREFRGGVPYTDPREFRGNIAGQDTDRFIAGSSGAQQSYSAPQNFLQDIQPFYGRRLATAPPAGFAQQGFTGTYVPATTVSGNASTPLDNRLD